MYYTHHILALPDHGYAWWDTGECGVVDASKPGSVPHQVVNDDTVGHHAIRWRLTHDASENDELLSPKEHNHEDNEVEVEDSIHMQWQNGKKQFLCIYTLRLYQKEIWQWRPHTSKVS